VNALDNALRRALGGAYPEVETVHLTDFKVRVLDARSGTAAKVRVLIESSDGEKTWTTVGVSENIIEASWLALVDSIDYQLLKVEEEGAAARKKARKPAASDTSADRFRAAHKKRAADKEAAAKKAAAKK
jgi:hypothetical protein